jgi:transcriptional regulator with XRE-family HTH domain
MTEPSIRRRLVGAALRRYRDNAGYTLADAAKVLDCDRSKISRIETGQRGIRPKELRELLTEYAVPDGEQAILTHLAGRYRERGWWDQHAALLPAAFTDYIIMESAAAEIMVYEPLLVPDLLQTADYARAIAAAQPGSITISQQDQAMAMLAARQQEILGGTRRLSVVLGEAALRQEVGGPDALAAQISHLTELAAGNPRITLQVLPFTSGAHAAGAETAHVILRFPDAPSLGVVYLPAVSGGFCLESLADLTRYLGTFALLRASALTPSGTAQLLRQAR